MKVLRALGLLCNTGLFILLMAMTFLCIYLAIDKNHDSMPNSSGYAIILILGLLASSFIPAILIFYRDILHVNRIKYKNANLDGNKSGVLDFNTEVQINQTPFLTHLPKGYHPLKAYGWMCSTLQSFISGILFTYSLLQNWKETTFVSNPPILVIELLFLIAGGTLFLYLFKMKLAFEKEEINNVQ